MGWAKYDEQFRLKKERYPTSSWGEVDVELWVMLVAQDQGQPPTTSLDKECYMGNMGSNHSFRNTQGPRNPREITQGRGQEWVQTTTMVMYQSPEASAMP